MAKSYRIKSIFGPTLQGEGTYAGRVVMFVRFAGCNRWSGMEKDRAESICSYCDTDFLGGTRMSPTDILARLQALGDCRRVVLSGGEPTIQIDFELLMVLHGAGYEIHLETNGSNALGDLLPAFTHITCSPKQPYAETKLEMCHDLKMLWPPISPAIVPEEFIELPYQQLFLQPVMDDKYEANMKATVREVLKRDARLSLQTHKITGVE